MQPRNFFGGLRSNFASSSSPDDLEEEEKVKRNVSVNELTPNFFGGANNPF
jgi:hypothetical protein